MSGYAASIVIPVLIDAIAVLGLYVIANAGRLSVGHAAFFGVGAYASALAATALKLGPWLAIPLGALAAAVIGLLFALIAERLTHWFFAIATLAFSVMLSGIVSSVDALGGATGLYGVPLTVDLPLTLMTFGVVLALVIVLDRSALGRAMRAVRDSEHAAQALAIDPRRMHAIAFMIGSAIAGIAGGLWAHYLGVVKPGDLSLDRSILFLVYLAVGGMESWAGALLGTFVLGSLPEVLRFSREYRLAFFGALLAIVMVLRPRGLLAPTGWRFGHKKRLDSQTASELQSMEGKSGG